MQFIVKLNHNQHTSHATSCDEADTDNSDAVISSLRARVAEEFKPLVDRQQINIVSVQTLIENVVREAIRSRKGGTTIHRINNAEISQAPQQHNGTDTFPDRHSKFLEIQVLDDDAVAARDAFVDKLFSRQA